MERNSQEMAECISGRHSLNLSPWRHHIKTLDQSIYFEFTNLPVRQSLVDDRQGLWKWEWKSSLTGPLENASWSGQRAQSCSQKLSVLSQVVREIRTAVQICVAIRRLC